MYAAKSSRDIVFVRSYMASRMLRTHATASSWVGTLFEVLRAVGSICGHLAGRVNRDGLVPRFEIHGVELPDLVEPHNVAKVPADDDIGARDGCEGNVQQVVAISFGNDTVRACSSSAASSTDTSGRKRPARKSSMSANDHTANSRSKQPPTTDVSRYTRGIGIP